MLELLSQIFGALGALPSRYQKTSVILGLLSAILGYFTMEYPINVIVFVFAIVLAILPFMESLSNEFRGALLAIWAFVIVGYFTSILIELVPNYIWCAYQEKSVEVCKNQMNGKLMMLGR